MLSLVAHLGRSIVKDLPGGHKLISKGGWNVPFEEVTTKEDGAPEHAGKKILGELASHCTNDNVQDFTLTGRNPKEQVCALIITSSVQNTSGINTYMVDKVNTHMITKDNVPTMCSLLRKLARISIASQSQDPAQQVQKRPNWDPNKTPYAAKKARRLCQSPTDKDMPSPTKLQPSPVE